jgi:hypothetical protein
MTDLLRTVAQSTRIAEAHPLDPFLFCRAGLTSSDFWFRVDDDGWYGWFVAQYPRAFDASSMNEMAELIRMVGRNGALFRVELNDGTGIVRGVIQLPIADQPRLEDDVPAVISKLTDEWGTLLPFLDRIGADETAEAVGAEARAAFDALDERKGRSRPMPPAATVGS